MSQNLVDGGARAGWFQTRHGRLVHLTEPFQFSEAQTPGESVKTRTCWRGVLFMADGKTEDTRGIWEQSGAFQVQSGVLQRNDLRTVVSLDPVPANPEPAELPPAA